MGLESIAEEGSSSLFSIVDFSNTQAAANQYKQKSSQQYMVKDYLNTTKGGKKMQYQQH